MTERTRIVVMLTQTDGTLIDEFIVEQMTHLANPETPVRLAEIVANVIQNRFETFEGKDT